MLREPANAALKGMGPKKRPSEFCGVHEPTLIGVSSTIEFGVRPSFSMADE